MYLLQLLDFNYLITKDKIEKDEDLFDFLTPKSEFCSDGWSDCNDTGLNEGDIIQFDWKGNAAILFSIPTSKKT